MNKPRLLDLCCKAGGASTGYDKAGFDVIGVDIEPQPNYPYRFIREDVMLLDLVGFDCYHASPPCQAHTMAGQQWRKDGRDYPDIIAPLRERLKLTGKPYVIENVPGSPLLNPIVLNGAMFGLKIRRTRLFETSFEVPFFLLPKEPHSKVRMGRPPRKDECITPVGHFSGVNIVKQIMGFEWMNQEELANAIPWQYTNFIGKFLMQAVEGR